AGVSRATASRALNGSSRNVRAEYRAKVLAAAEELRYFANTAAQAVARGRSAHLTLLVNGIDDDYFSPIAAGLLRAAEEVDQTITMVSSRNSARRATEI